MELFSSIYSSNFFPPCTAQVHDGKAGGGTYRVHVHRKSEDIWYEVQDLNVQDILPQVCISRGVCISKQGCVY